MGKVTAFSVNANVMDLMRFDGATLRTISRARNDSRIYRRAAARRSSPARTQMARDRQLRSPLCRREIHSAWPPAQETRKSTQPELCCRRRGKEK